MMSAPTDIRPASGPQVELGELIEHQVFGRFAFTLMVFASITMFLEGFEMQLVGYAAPVMIKALQVDMETATKVIQIATGSLNATGNAFSEQFKHS